ncbi:MAG: M23 family metallopeptidase [Betaproteobacteria bacterium]|nr:M23 family metallopeptidase [Betaproteobacteria bacterium]MDH5341336.1 M23 family metallopeptidase [Betaproteobacteria bacterium]
MFQARFAILAQKLSAWLRGRGPRRLLLGLVLPFVGVMAAFGIAPDTITDNVVRSNVVEELQLTAAPVVESADDTYWRETRVERGDTIASILQRLQIDDTSTSQVLQRAREARALYRLIPGRTVRAQTTGTGQMLALRYLNGTQLLKIDRDGDILRVWEGPAEVETRVLMRAGDIRSSLFAATDAAGMSDAVALQIAEVFSTDIDFHRDLRRGDRFAAIYEIQHHLGEPVKTGRLLSAEFVNQGKTFHAVWFENPEGQGGYYTLDGKNIRKAFLRSPLEFSRISSGFTGSRFHPVLKTWRAHMGVDYAAATGTRVRTTGDGIVDFAGRQGGYGNLVVVRHQSKYTTWYGHLSRFGPGIHKGKRVSQGEVIGYVGSTGLATGPHLHYEFRTNNVHQDPLRVVMPPAPPLAPQYRIAFDEVARPMAEGLALLRQQVATTATQ